MRREAAMGPMRDGRTSSNSRVAPLGCELPRDVGQRRGHAAGAIRNLHEAAFERDRQAVVGEQRDASYRTALVVWF